MKGLNFFKDTYADINTAKFSSRDELYDAIKKKSIRSLLWICIINILILTFFVFSSFVYQINSQQNVNAFPSLFLQIADYALLILPVVFTLICAYLIYKIKAKNTVETLLLSVKNAKNGLKLYLSLILVAYLIIIYITIYQTIVSGTNDTTLDDSFSFYAAIILTCVVCTIVILLILWLLYKLLYSRFLRSLTKNYYVLKDFV